MSNVPIFDFTTPQGYDWLINKNVVGFELSSQLEPWHYLPAQHVFDLQQKWPFGPSRKRLVAFAKRQDCDDLACFEVEQGRAGRVVLVHGWTEQGYEVEQELNDFWEWLKLVIDDIAEWVDSHAQDSATKI